LAIIAALHDVLRDMGQVESWLAGHGGFRAGEGQLSCATGSRSARPSHDVSSGSALRPRFSGFEKQGDAGCLIEINMQRTHRLRLATFRQPWSART
jgi:hypothetical protein